MLMILTPNPFCVMKCRFRFAAVTVVRSANKIHRNTSHTSRHFAQQERFTTNMDDTASKLGTMYLALFPQKAIFTWPAECFPSSSRCCRSPPWLPEESWSRGRRCNTRRSCTGSRSPANEDTELHSGNRGGRSTYFYSIRFSHSDFNKPTK